MKEHREMLERERVIMTHSLALQVLYTSKTFKLSIDHNSQSGTQCLTLLHTKQREKKQSQNSPPSLSLPPSPTLPVRCQYDTPSFPYYSREDVPQEPSGRRVHSSSRFIKQQDRWITDKGYSCTQLPLVTTTKIQAKLV